MNAKKFIEWLNKWMNKKKEDKENGESEKKIK